MPYRLSDSEKPFTLTARTSPYGGSTRYVAHPGRDVPASFASAVDGLGDEDRARFTGSNPTADAFDAGFPHRAELIGAGVARPADLADLSDDEILAYDGVGPAGLKKIRAAAKKLA